MGGTWGKGHVIMGRYELVSLLGSGGMGSVWRAEHVQLKSPVAVKLLDPAIAQNEEMLGRFLREARASAALKNRHIVHVSDHGVEDGTAFMVMELLHGETLGSRISRLGALSSDETIRFMSQVMRAIARAHDAGVIHRDLKPDNIFICNDEDEEYAKVLDFGVAKVASSEFEQEHGLKTQTGMMIGTPYYMSPEQAKAKPVDPRTDVWALAVITYECLTGQRPYNGESFAELLIGICSAPTPIPSKIAPVPAGFDEWFVHGTQRDVDRRFRNAREMADELVQLAQAPLVGRRPGTSEVPTVRGHQAPQAVRPAPAGRREPLPQAQQRMALTTGQSAASVYELTGAANGSGMKWLIGGIVAIAAATVLTFVVVRRPAEVVAAPPTTEVPVSVAAAPVPVLPAPVAAPEVVPAPPAPPAPAAEVTAAPIAEKPVAPVAAKTTVKETEAAKAKSTKGKTPVATPAPTSTGQKVPVVDGTALPPKDWEF